MILRRLSVLHYRNLQDATLSFPPGLCAVTGGNAQGKTNLLEAIDLVLTGRLDAPSLDTVVAFGETEAFVGASLERDDGVSELSVGLGRGRRVAKVDGARVNAAELARQASAVWLRPEDAELATGAPAARRRYLDALLQRLSARYGRLLDAYERVVAQRNALLRAEGVNLDEALPVWDERLAEYGQELMLTRRRAVTRLTRLAREAHASLAPKTLEVTLKETAEPDALLESLRGRRREESARGLTLSGPHRDDLGLTLDGLDATRFASRGEARTVALALRKAEFDLLHEKHSEPPLLLIDDYSAELDATRRDYLLNLATSVPQAIVTGTDAPEQAGAFYRMDAGRLLPGRGAA
ncbi:MAG TPA: DNA replication and repair protein RecF [Deinococcales bacterium]|nr:DNA replication and repair protein RecF [Deinococcales bacterium]